MTGPLKQHSHPIWSQPLQLVRGRKNGKDERSTSHPNFPPEHISWQLGSVSPHHIGQQQLWWLCMLIIRFPLLILYPQHCSFCTGPCCLYLHFPVFTHEAYPFGEHPLCSSSRTPVVHHKHLLPHGTFSTHFVAVLSNASRSSPTNSWRCGGCRSTSGATS